MRMILQRIERGEATGILCPPEQIELWIERLREVPLLQRVGGDTLYSPNGAIVVFRTTPEEARAWELNHPKRVIWIDEENVLEAPYPAPKKEE